MTHNELSTIPYTYIIQDRKLERFARCMFTREQKFSIALKNKKCKHGEFEALHQRNSSYRNLQAQWCCEHHLFLRLAERWQYMFRRPKDTIFRAGHGQALVISPSKPYGHGALELWFCRNVSKILAKYRLN